MKRLILLGLLVSSFVWAQPQPHNFSFSQIKRIPIQNGGRLKPLDSFAREWVLGITGSRTFKGFDSVDLILSWISFPNEWEKEPFIRINRKDVKKQLLLSEDRKYFSPQELTHNAAFLQYADQIASEMGGQGVKKAQVTKTGVKEDGRQRELKTVLGRLTSFRRVTSGEVWTLVPDPQKWKSIADSSSAPEIEKSFKSLIRAYVASEKDAFSQAAVLLKGAVEGKMKTQGADIQTVQSRAGLETLSNEIRFFQKAWSLYLLAGLCFLMMWVSQRKRWKVLAWGLVSLGFVFHVLGFGIRVFLTQRAPVTNMYESIVWVSFGVMVFAFILYRLQKKKILMTTACFLSALALIAADANPTMLNPGLDPLVPVLRSNFWLTIHVLTITLGYAAFALTYGLANINLFHFLAAALKAKKEKVKPKVSPKMADLNQLTYRAMQFGVVLLAAGTILGGVWADYSWGRFWGWDPKEVWALIALLCYLAILHGRYAGWVRPFGFAAWSVLGFTSVVMAWYGVNFVLGVGLHSYGFASGGMEWVATAVLIQIILVLLVSFFHKRAS